MIAGPVANPEAQARYRGLRAPWPRRHARRCAPDGIWRFHPRQWWPGGGRSSLTPRLAGEVMPSCVPTTSWLWGRSTSSTGRGVRVPRDLSLVGFDDLDFARYARVPLTTVRQPVTEQVRHAVRTLAGALAWNSAARAAITFETEFVRRRSCGCNTRSRERVCPGPGRARLRISPAPCAPRQESVVADLRQAAHGGFDFVPEDWERRLFLAFFGASGRTGGARLRQLCGRHLPCPAPSG